jgi:CubicO group peptidase (beta-lactamase class C family)
VSRQRLTPQYVIGSAAATPKRTLSIRRVEYMEGLTGFEAQLDSLRVELHTPGMSAAIVQDEEVIRSMGFGLADVDEGRLATPTTSLHLASLTRHSPQP